MKIRRLIEEDEDDLSGFMQLDPEAKDKPNDSNADLTKAKKEKEEEQKKKEKEQKEKEEQEKQAKANSLKELIDSAVEHLRNKEDDEAEADINAWLTNIGF